MKRVKIIVRKLISSKIIFVAEFVAFPIQKKATITSYFCTLLVTGVILRRKLDISIKIQSASTGKTLLEIKRETN